MHGKWIKPGDKGNKGPVPRQGRGQSMMNKIDLHESLHSYYWEDSSTLTLVIGHCVHTLRKYKSCSCVNCKSILYFLEHEWMPPSPGWCGWSVVTFLSTLVNTQPAAGESWTDKIYVKPVAFLVLWWFSMVLGASKIGSFLHIVLVLCQFLSIFANLFMHNKKCHPLLPQFCFLFSGSIFWGDVLQQNRKWASAQVSTPQNARGWDCQYSAPIVPCPSHCPFSLCYRLSSSLVS